MSGRRNEIACPHCREHILVDSEGAPEGSTLKCPVCKKESRITVKGVIFGRRVALEKA